MNDKDFRRAVKKVIIFSAYEPADEQDRQQT